jgi:hypothetical protein
MLWRQCNNLLGRKGVGNEGIGVNAQYNDSIYNSGKFTILISLYYFLKNDSNGHGCYF